MPTTFKTVCICMNLSVSECVYMLKPWSLSSYVFRNAGRYGEWDFNDRADHACTCSDVNQCRRAQSTLLTYLWKILYLIAYKETGFRTYFSKMHKVFCIVLYINVLSE